MSDIFICYSRQDLSIADKLIRYLQESGWTVFIDRQTHVGQRWHQEIEQELHAAKTVVVLWSASSRESDFVLEGVLEILCHSFSIKFYRSDE
ncbi:MAG: toll/interleukin-1 receptor domain-containing protein [Burkholderiales bacterium]|nr:toll/interleukin-1 receptor domain-containing protein [Burkholderiales bacterium]MDR4518228.1 toll/interleukin-1 receptor domain-containing protein [Nitrosomonas sp.]